MFEPVRGGTRGGQAEFKWSDVSQDKDRENYLGHSINAPTGRWQKNKDIHWYQRDQDSTAEALAEEIRQLKEAEAEALSAALGFAAGGKPGVPNAVAGPATGSNAVAVPNTAAISPEEAERDLAKAERRRRKAERKEEKKARKEEKRKRKDEREDERDGDGHRHHRHHRSQTRSRSPERHSPEHNLKRRPRSRTPPAAQPSRYDEDEREKERERDRKRWADSSRREQPGARWGRG